MYVTRVPNRSSPPAVLLRESFREDGKVKTRTLANLTHWPDAKVEALRRVLRGETVIAAAEHVEIERSLPHGHVAAVLGTLRAIGLDRLLPRRPERLARLALALIVARVVEPAAKLATARQLSGATAAHSLGAVLGFPLRRLGRAACRLHHPLFHSLGWRLSPEGMRGSPFYARAYGLGIHP